MLGGNLLSAISMWLITLYLLRTSHLEELGVLSLVQSLGLILFVFFTFKLLNVQITDVKEKFTNSDYYFARVLAGSLLISISMIYSYFLNYENIIKLALIFYSFYYSIMIFREYFSAHYQKNQDYRKLFISNALNSFLILISFVGCFYLTNNIVYSIIAIVLSSLVCLIIDHLMIFKDLKKIYSDINLKSSISLIKEYVFLGLSAIFISTLILVPRFYIENHYGLEALGIFSALTSIIFFINIFLNSITQIFLKNLSNVYNQNKKLAVKNIINKFYLINLLIVLGLILFFFIKEYIALIIFGEDFTIYSNELFYSVLIALFLFWFNYGNFILTVQRNFSVQIYISIFCFLSQLIFCYIFVESYNYIGAFIAMGLTYFLGFLLSVLIFIRKDFFLGKYNGRFK